MLSLEELEVAKSKEGKTQCPGCKKWYSQVGNHWAKSECSIPELTNEQKEILVGILMGDGNITRPPKSNRGTFRVRMTKWEFLYWLDKEFGIMSTGLRLAATASQCAKKTGGDPENYNPQWVVRIRACGFVDELYEWYSSGKKNMPEDIEMTPTVFKMWYVCDGTLGDNKYIMIGCDNEYGNGDKICSWFEEAGLPEPSVYEGKDGRMQLRWKAEESKELFEYMGSPPPGFEYKWP